MGEGDRGAGSLHFFVPGPRVRGGCGRSGNGSHAPPGEAGAEAGSLHFLCPTPGEGRLRRGRSGVRNGSEAPSGRAAKGPDGTRKSTGEKSPGRRGPRPEQKRSPKRQRSPIRRSGEGPDGTRKSTGEKRAPRESDIVGLPGNSPLPVHCRPHYLLNMPA